MTPPFKVYQCGEPCCTIQPHSKRFWHADFFGAKVSTETTRLAALRSAVEFVESMPQEVTA